MTVWIGYLQWTRANGFGWPQDPVLRPMDNFQCKDAILEIIEPPVGAQAPPPENKDGAHAEGAPWRAPSPVNTPNKPKQLREPDWPKVDFIVGNPPFLGNKFLRRELGDEFVDALFTLWKGRVSNSADLCCYWFEKARSQIERGLCRRAGLLATQGIRGGANREVLNRIKETGDIFFAESDRPWILDGANVHVSMIGFDNGEEKSRDLDGIPVAQINSNLSAIADITKAKKLSELGNLCYMGDTKGGSFDIDESLAVELLRQPNAHPAPNSDVIIPWVNGMDVTRRSRGMWIIDFGVGILEEQAACYEAPFEYLREHVKPLRDNNKREVYRRLWWQHAEARPGMRSALSPLPRFLCTISVAKHRLFVWMEEPTLPDHQLYAFSRPDDYFFGVLHSRLHEVWALRLGTRLETRPRYTPTTCFETFPFPWPPGEEPQDDPVVQTIAEAAKELDELRSNWLNPPEWTKEEILEFPGSLDGPWRRYIVAQPSPAENQVGRVRYPRLVPKDDASAKQLKKRTLTNLYNQRPTWLDLAHKKLDEAVFAAYGWKPAMTDEEILEKLLALNLERAGG